MVYGLKRILVALALASTLLGSSAWAQSCTGQFGAGRVCGNSGSATGLPSPQLFSPLLDRNFTSGTGALIMRSASAWTDTLAATSTPIINFNAAALPSALTGSVINFGGADATTARVQLNAFGATPVFVGASYGGTNATPTAVVNGTQLTSIGAWVYNGATLVGPVSSFRSYAAEDIASGHQGSKACLATTPTSSTTMADGFCQQPSGGTTVGSPTGSDKGSGTVNVASAYYVNGSAVIPFLVSGTSGGIPYFNSTTTMASSALLVANRIVLGGGAGTTPATLGSLGTTTTLLHGNAAGAPTFAAVSLTADVSGQLPLANGGTNANLTASNGGIFYSTASAGAILSGTATANQMLQSGTSAAPAWSTATWPATTTTQQLLYSSAANTVGGLSVVNGAIPNYGATGTLTNTITPVLGVPTTSKGTLGFAGNTSGTATITPQAAAGTPTLTLPNASGTFAISASSPIALSATTGALTCATCVTSSGGGAITGTAPVAVSAAGAVSITGASGQVLAGASPAFTATPTLGVTGSALGTLTLAGNTSGSVLITPQAAAGSTTLTAPNTSGTIAVGAASPLVLSTTTGGLTCPTCATSSGGGAATGTAPVAVSAAGVVSITGAAGQVLAGASPAFTNAPTLGVAGASVGSLIFANATSGSATIQPATGALASSVWTLRAATDNFVGASTTDTLANKTISAGITTGVLDVQGALKTSTQSAPSQITSNQNDYNPSSVVCTTSTTLLINSDAARDITGMAGGATGCRMSLVNNGSFTITLKEQNASSSATNRFALGGDYALAASAAVTFLYDGTATRWRNIGSISAGAGTGTVTSVTCGTGLSGGAISTSGTCAALGYQIKGYQTYTSGSGTYTLPANVRAILVELWGGGGGGGYATGASSQSGLGGGGGGGAYCRSFITSPSVSYAYALGAGGSAGTSGVPTPATDGGDTTLGSTVVVAKGGSAGVGDTAAVPPKVGAAGGAGGLSASSTGDFCLNGGRGGSGMAPSSTAAIGMTGSGGASGTGTPGPTTSVVSGGGTNGFANSGAGGEGGFSATAAGRSGGGGGSGYIRITEFY